MESIETIKEYKERFDKHLEKTIIKPLVKKNGILDQSIDKNGYSYTSYMEDEFYRMIDAAIEVGWKSDYVEVRALALSLRALSLDKRLCKKNNMIAAVSDMEYLEQSENYNKWADRPFIGDIDMEQLWKNKYTMTEEDIWGPGGAP